MLPATDRQQLQQINVSPLLGNFGNCGTSPSKLKLLSVKFELGRWKFSDLYRLFITECAEAIHYGT